MIWKGLLKGWRALGATWLLIAGLFGSGPAWAYEIWVTNQGTDQVHVIDGDALRELAVIPTDANPNAIEFSADFTRAFVSCIAAGSVTVIDAVSRKKIATIATGKGAHSVNRSPDGRLLYVANSGDRTVSVIDTASLKVSKTFSAGEAPTAVGFSPDGTTAYVAHAGGSLSVIDVKKAKVVRRVPGLGGGIGLAISKDGKKGYVAAGFEDTVAVVDTRTGRVLSTIRTGKDAHAVFLTPDGTSVWVVNRLSNTIAIVGTDHDRIVRTIENVGDRPDILVLAPDGRKAFVTLHGKVPPGYPEFLSGSEPGLSVIDVTSGRVITKMRLNGDPHGVAVRP